MDLGFNKIAFSVLATGLTVIGLNELSHAFFHEAHHEKMGYEIAISEGGEGGTTTEVVAGPVDYGVLLSMADPAAGKTVAVKCLQCHKFEAGGGALQGPELWNILGRDVASVSGFKYSEGDGSLSALEGVWDYEKLDLFLKRPKGYTPATQMNFVGIGKEKDRMALIAYLRTLTPGEPMPLPAPLPPQAEAPVVDAAAVDPAAAPVEGAAPAPDQTTAPAAGAPTDAAPAPAGAAPPAQN